MNRQKRICAIAAFSMAMLAATGCAGIQTARLAAPPDFAAIEQNANLADAAAAGTVRDSRKLVAQTTVAEKSNAGIAALRPAVATLERDAQKTRLATRATVAELKPALKQQALFVQSARSVQAGELHNAARYDAISHSLSYKLGRFIVVTVFLLLVAVGLILFSESGWAGILAVKWPILAQVLFKPVAYLGALLGKLWGLVESALRAMWQVIAHGFMPAAKTLS